MRISNSVWFHLSLETTGYYRHRFSIREPLSTETNIVLPRLMSDATYHEEKEMNDPTTRQPNEMESCCALRIQNVGLFFHVRHVCIVGALDLTRLPPIINRVSCLRAHIHQPANQRPPYDSHIWYSFLAAFSWRPISSSRHIFSFSLATRYHNRIFGWRRRRRKSICCKGKMRFGRFPRNTNEIHFSSVFVAPIVRIPLAETNSSKLHNYKNELRIRFQWFLSLSLSPGC